MPLGPVDGSASTSLVYRACTRFAIGWLHFYSSDVDPRFAADRAVEVELELWEHAIAADRNWSPGRAAASLLCRTVAGAPQDLRWRRAVREPELWVAPPVRPLVREHRRRFWVPLQNGHVFDQTNGLAEPETY